MTLSDSFSRMKKQTSEADSEINLDHRICFVQFSTQKLDDLKEATHADDILLPLADFIMDGFPARVRDLPKPLRPYWPCRDELSIENGLILKGTQVIIPSSLRSEYLNRIHEGHLGITRCQQRARNSIFWPGINQDIVDVIRQCQPCQTHQKSQAKEPMEPILINTPNVPFHTLGCDLFSLNDKDYLVIGDYYSKYPFVEHIRSQTSEVVSRIFIKLISQFGIPNTIISDNGPCFIGHQFQHLMQRYNINHVTSSPHYPKSHGFIERLVQTAKNLLKKSHDLDGSLLTYRTTPLGHDLPSPAELLFGRKLQHNLPVYVRGYQNDSVHEKMALHQDKSAESYDKNSHELEDLHLHQSIYFQDVAKRTWHPGKITGIGPEPRSYTIKCETSGTFLRRNRIHLRPRPPGPLKESSLSPNPVPEPISSNPVQLLIPIGQSSSDSSGFPCTRYGRVIVPPDRLTVGK